MRVLGTGPRERLTEVAIVVYVCVNILVLIFIGISKGLMDNTNCPWL